MVVRGAGERVAPVLTAAGAIAIAFLPVLLRSGVPGHEIVRPMALMVVGGLVTSGLVTLLLTPALYLRLAMGRSDAAPTEPRRRPLRPRRLSQEATQ
jgi:Cu/Ag efflux pump CusA